MTFKTDAQSDIAEIINDTDAFGIEVIHTPLGGVAQPAFNCIVGESILNGDDYKSTVNEEDAAITCVSDDVAAVRRKDTITKDGIDYKVVNDPIPDAEFSNVSVVVLRRKLETEI